MIDWKRKKWKRIEEWKDIGENFVQQWDRIGIEKYYFNFLAPISSNITQYLRTKANKGFASACSVVVEVSD